jgi:vitamin B12 transporter
MRRSVLVQSMVWVFAAACLIGSTASTLSAQDASIRGTVLDPLGGAVPGATVRLVRGGQRLAETASDARGDFSFERLTQGRYQLDVNAPGFEPRMTDPMFVGKGGATNVDVRVQIGPLLQQVVVTAAATELAESQVGSSVTVLDSSTLEALGKPDVLEALRLVPGAHVVQTGARGGPTWTYIRGGEVNFTKLLIDGVPANDIGGAVDFAEFATTGVDRIEILRESNSVMFGSDALAGVISLTTRRGRSRIPEASYSIDGGNLSTFRQTGSVGGAVQRFDYFSEYSHFDTDNDLPNNEYRNNTYAGRFGVAFGRNTDVSGAVRVIDRRYGSPDGIDFYAIPDDAVQEDSLKFFSTGVRSQFTDRWQGAVRFGSFDQTVNFTDPTPSGIFDGFNYLGDVVTIVGANGFSTTGQAILDFSGDYPSLFATRTTRRLIYGQTSYHIASNIDISGGGHFDHEQGFDDPEGDTTTTRNNGGLFVEGRATVGRLGVTAGLGYEHNEAFKSAYSPRVSVAYYVKSPSPKGGEGDTKLIFNAGKGIKAPSIFQEQSSLFTILGPAQAEVAGVSPIGPERSRTLDVGIEQRLHGGRARVRVAYFNNEFHDLIEFVNKAILPIFGVPPDVAAATDFGANVNSQSYKAQGVETAVDAVFGHFHVAVSYTYLDAEVTESLSNGALQPAFNPAFPDVPVGQFAPLVGQRPFRRPKNLGSMLITYRQGPAQISLAGCFSGKSNDSTFLFDQFFGFGMLLPNEDLNDGYQKIDLSGSYRLNTHIKWYLTLENILGERYTPAFGFPALPRNVRTGVTLTMGGGN